MPVDTRTWLSTDVKSLPALGALTEDGGARVFFCAGITAEQITGATGGKANNIKGGRRALNALLPRTDGLTPKPPEIQLCSGKSVLFAIRTAETPEATLDWLTYHARAVGAETAVILDRSAPGQVSFAHALADLNPAMPVLVVTCDRPLGRADGPDMSDPNTAPAAPKRSAPRINPWRAPLWERGFLDLIYYAYLAQARAVAFLNISDLLLPAPDQVNPFDLAVTHTNRAVALKGIETYPWRLRKGQPAPHGDHIARRRTERRGLLSWAFAPGHCPDLVGFAPGKPLGLMPADTAAPSFIRAIGIVYPGVEVGHLVKKSELREEPGLIPHLTQSFDRAPLRLPRAAPIAPRPTDPRLTIVTAMKNEGPFVLDWIAHNRALGAAHHLVYTNDCEDGTDRLLDCLQDAGVTRRDNPYRHSGKVPQYAAFRAAEDEKVVEQANWLLPLDVDEYINIHTGDGRLVDLLTALPDAHVISMPWRLFGNADQPSFQDQPVTQRFTRCAPAFAPRPLQAWAFKSLYRNAGLFRRMGVHRPKGLNATVQDSLSWVDAGGRPMPASVWQRAWRMSKGQWGYEHVTLNHYAVRSAESFLIKRERGKGNRTKRAQGLAYWFRMNHNAEKDMSIQRLARRVAAEKAALMALPGVAEAHEQAVAWHQARARQLRADPDYAALFAQITSPRMQHLSRIATNFGANVHLAGPQVIPDDVAATPEGAPFYWTVKLDKP